MHIQNSFPDTHLPPNSQPHHDFRLLSRKSVYASYAPQAHSLCQKGRSTARRPSQPPADFPPSPTPPPGPIVFQQGDAAQAQSAAIVHYQALRRNSPSGWWTELSINHRSWWPHGLGRPLLVAAQRVYWRRAPTACFGLRHNQNATDLRRAHVLRVEASCFRISTIDVARPKPPNDCSHDNP
jgi:hypothetical protein